MDRASLDRGAAALERLGFRVRVDRRARLRRGYLAGNDHERAESFVEAILDPEVRAVFLARGGYGSARILPLVAPQLGRANPKIVVGYSDATALLSLLTDRLGWVTFHGPMVSTDLAGLRPADRRSLLESLSGTRPRPIPLRQPLVSGSATGTLRGGCLSIVVSLLATPCQPAFDRSILFLEDHSEKPYRLDRMLTQLRQAGGLDGVRGLVLGEMPGCGGSREVARVVREATAGLDFPIALGLPSGHGRGKRTLPLGARVRLDTTRSRLEVLEAVVSPR
jgi:muramoyltetrapeptide carboxypeptidase